MAVPQTYPCPVWGDPFMNRKSWQRMILSLAGIIIIGIAWRIAIDHLYSLKPEALASFTTITTNAFYVVGAIVIFMVTGRLVYEWKLNTASQISEIGYHGSERISRPRDYDNGDI